MAKKKPGPMKGWRTVMFNILGMATMAATSDYAAIIPQEALPYIGTGLAVGNLILRLNTDTPVTKSTPKENQ